MGSRYDRSTGLQAVVLSVHGALASAPSNCRVCDALMGAHAALGLTRHSLLLTPLCHSWCIALCVCVSCQLAKHSSEDSPSLVQVTKAALAVSVFVRACVRACLPACMRACMCVHCVCARLRVFVCMHACLYVCECVRACVCACVRACVCACVRVCVHAQIPPCACLPACLPDTLPISLSRTNASMDACVTLP